MRSQRLPQQNKHNQTQHWDAVAAVQVNYPSFEFRETLKAFRPNPASNGGWTLLTFERADAQEQVCKAACTVLRHYYPDENFTVTAYADNPDIRTVTA